MTDKIPKKRDKKVIIFGLIGVFNTLFDMALYVSIQYLTGSIIIANIAATSAALIGSYLLNSKLTFKAKKWTVKGFVLFVVVTLFGLWVLQTFAIYLLTPVVGMIPEFLWRPFGPLEDIAKVLAPKVVATVITVVWNFLWYNKVIFKDKNPEEDLIRSLE
ncbi:MAG TPA: GtrA family protein [Candidatus Microsaccharimonas sp.]|jgi:putative flippase GtrA